MTTPHTSASLYVGDLHPEVTEAMLFEIFKQVGPVAFIRVCRDTVTRRSLGYAYVNFTNVVDAERALDTLNYTPVRGKAVRIMWSHRDPSLRKSGAGNVFIKNLAPDIDNKALYDTFSTFGNILSCKVANDEGAKSRGYGFVHYETQEAADMAIAKVNGMLLNNKLVYVGPFIPKKDLQKKFTNVYVKNLDKSYDANRLKELFSKYGEIQNAVVMNDEKGSSKGFGFVNFKNHEDALAAVGEMNGQKIGDTIMYAGRAQKKSEREAELKRRWKEIQQERLTKYQGVNLYVKNLDDAIDDERLKAEFVPFGQITSARVMRDDKAGTSKGFGFVCFKTPEEATKAVQEMNGRMIGAKPVYVALAQRKEVRRAQLEAQHASRGGGIRMQGVPPGAAVPGAPVPYGGPMFYPPQPGMPAPGGRGLVYPGPQGVMRPRWNGPPGAMPNYVMPGGMNQRGPRRGAQGGPRGGVPGGQPNGAGGRPAGGMGPGGRGRPNFKYTGNVRNQPLPEELAALGAEGVPPVIPVGLPGGEVIPGIVPGMIEQPIPVAIPAGGPVGGPIDLSNLASFPPEERKNLLGEILFPLIQKHQPELTGKITGMLLESMDHAELLHLIESPEALHSKISEAVQVLHAAAGSEGAPGSS